MTTMTDRLARKNFERVRDGVWRRVDDVYETLVEQGVNENFPDSWTVSVINHEDEDDIAPELDATAFWVSERGEFLAGDGVDKDTARVLYPEILFADQLFMQQNGRIVCPAHGGSYLQSALEADPLAFDIQTPLDHWERITFPAPSISCEDCKDLTPCCRATKTYVEGVLSCKNCYEAVPA